MKDMPCLIYHTHRAGTKYTRFLHQPTGHDTMNSEQVIHGIRIKFIQSLVNFIGILDLRNIFGWCQNMLAIEDSCYLLQT